MKPIKVQGIAGRDFVKHIVKETEKRKQKDIKEGKKPGELKVIPLFDKWVMK